MTEINPNAPVCTHCAVRRQIELCATCGKAKSDVQMLLLIEVQAIRAEQKRLVDGGSLIPTRLVE